MTNRTYNPIHELNKNIRKPFTRFQTSNISTIYNTISIKLPESMHVSIYKNEKGHNSMRFDALKSIEEYMDIETVDPDNMATSDIQIIKDAVIANTHPDKNPVSLSNSHGCIVYYSINEHGTIMFLIDAETTFYQGKAQFMIEDFDEMVAQFDRWIAHIKPIRESTHRNVGNSLYNEYSDAEGTIRVQDNITIPTPPNYTYCRLPNIPGFKVYEVFVHGDSDFEVINISDNLIGKNYIRINDFRAKGMSNESAQLLRDKAGEIQEDGSTLITNFTDGMLKILTDQSEPISKIVQPYTFNDLVYFINIQPDTDADIEINVIGATFIYNIEIGFANSTARKELTPLIIPWLKTIQPTINKRS